MKRSGPDSLNSWIISVVCCFINVMFFGTARLVGLLFVASVSRFNISRAKAAFPYTFSNFVRSISGPLVGFLGHRYGVRKTTTIGCFLGAIGAGTCYFAENINAVTVLWGAVLGLGFGLGNILLPVAINQHFDKQRATASGIAFSGACIGSFVLTPITEVLLNTYGLSGTFLLLSGFILNCVPAALLLKKPKFETKTKQAECVPAKPQSITDEKLRKQSFENIRQAYQIALKDETVVVNTGSKTLDESHCKCDSEKTCNVKGDKFSYQSLAPNNSFQVKSSHSLNSKENLENATFKRRDDSIISDTVSLPSRIAHQNIDAFQRDICFTSENSNVTVIPPEQNHSHLEEDVFTKNQTYLNRGYLTDTDGDDEDHGLDPHDQVILPQDVYMKECAQSVNAAEISINNSVLGNSENSPDESRNYSNNSRNLIDSGLGSSIYNCEKTKDIIISPVNKVSQSKGKSPLGSFGVIFDPMFILIAVTNSIYNFTFNTLFTIIIDYCHDQNIGLSNEKYILMALSVGDLFGRLGLGWVTDRGYMTTTAFAALCFACQAITTAALVWLNSFSFLIILVILYGIEEGGIIVIMPIIIGRYIDPDKQTVAISSSHFLTGPLCLLISPMIGYFRDEAGAYDYIFYIIAILSAGCSVCILLSPYVAKYKSRSKCQTK